MRDAGVHLENISTPHQDVILEKSVSMIYSPDWIIHVNITYCIFHELLLPQPYNFIELLCTTVYTKKCGAAFL